MVAAASPPPPLPHAAPGRAHPTYTKMIKHALAELGGCSARPAIAGYILERFSGFPDSHDALLSAHLRRLVAEGVLRTRTDASYIFAPAVPVAGGKRGPGRPRKIPQGSSENAHTPLLPAKRKRTPSPSPTPATEDAPSQPGDDDPVTRRGPGRPLTTQQADAVQVEQASTFQNGAGVQSGGTGAKRGRGRPRKENPSAAPAAMSPPQPSSTKRGRGRPRKHKPPEATANSPTTGAAASRGFKRGCGRPSMDRASAAVVSAEASMEKLAATAAAMYAETGYATSTGTEAGGGQSRMEELAAAVAAMSAEGTKRGRGRPRKDKPSPPAAGVKRSHGRPAKDRSIRPGLVESAYEAFFRDMMAEASGRLEEEDSVSGEKTTQAEMGVATGEGKETRSAADAAGSVPVSGDNASSAPAPAGATDHDLDPANLADDAVSTGIKRPRGRPRKNKPSATADDGMSTGVKRGCGRPRTEKLEEAMPAETGDAAPPMGVKRGRGRPRKERLEEGMSAETGDAAPTVVKRGRGRPRKDQSSGSGFAEAAGEALFRDMAKAPGDIGEDRD